MRIAVTGGNGRFGHTLVPYLMEQGHTVVSIDRALPPMATPPLAQRAQAMVADTRDFGEFVASIRGCDALVHLAAHPSPGGYPDAVIYADNTVSSYNALSAAATLNIKRVCLASSINAIGGAFSRAPRYDYFPLDEQHPTYAEDPYSLSKWVLEQQADAFARRYEEMSVASLRFHGLVETRERAEAMARQVGFMTIRHLWAYTLLYEASRACLLALTADFVGHEAFYIVAPRTTMLENSLDLAREHFPNTPIQGDLSGQTGFFNCVKAARVLGWHHMD
ncbi:MAG: NAD(P)-dependent oxidoreductase [Herpetosiphonaceae bacterium]|nr:NAD(P)-dependent oxidoreductase [Herpetosiphonaceae bacterium]